MKENLLEETDFQWRWRSPKEECSPKQSGVKHLKRGNRVHMAFFFLRGGLSPALYF